jgi:predicted RND superfamily exporter protein
MKIKDLVSRYAHFVSYNPTYVLIAAFLVTIVAIFYASNVSTETSDNRDIIPEGYPVIEAFDVIEDEFGGSESALIVVGLDPSVIRSDEPRDIRDPEILTYISALTDYARTIDDVLSVESAATVLRRGNGGTLPKSKTEILMLEDTIPQLANYYGRDKSLALVRLTLADAYEPTELVSEMQSVVDSIKEPIGVNTRVAGAVAADVIVSESISPDMARTSNFSIIGIVVVLLFLFRSFRFSFTPLVTIIVGIIWAFGYLGMRGINLNSMTSGVISMTIGIGIDFGIQIVTRYLQERRGKKSPEESMKGTLEYAFLPMTTTTLSALIGFRAMSMGELTFLEELGNIMSYGITACFLVALTAVPAIVVLSERIKKSKIRKNRQKTQQLFTKLHTLIHDTTRR